MAKSNKKQLKVLIKKRYQLVCLICFRENIKYIETNNVTSSATQTFSKACSLLLNQRQTNLRHLLLRDIIMNISKVSGSSCLQGKHYFGSHLQCQRLKFFLCSLSLQVPRLNAFCSFNL